MKTIVGLKFDQHYSSFERSFAILSKRKPEEIAAGENSDKEKKDILECN